MFIFFFFNDTATTEIYTLSLHDALPISLPAIRGDVTFEHVTFRYRLDGPEILHDINLEVPAGAVIDRKSTRLNSSHQIISYAVFCLKKKKKKNKTARCALLPI